MHYQLEVGGQSATVYIGGSLDRAFANTLLTVFARIPKHVRTLRLDLRALGTMTAEARSAVRMLLRSWCDSRKGNFRLRTSYLVATCTEYRDPVPAPRRISPSPRTAALVYG